MIVLVRGQHWSNVLEVDENIPVGDLQRFITNRHYSGYLCRIELVFQGRDLRPEPTLEDYGIPDGSTLTIELRFKKVIVQCNESEELSCSLRQQAYYASD